MLCFFCFCTLERYKTSMVSRQTQKSSEKIALPVKSEAHFPSKPFGHVLPGMLPVSCTSPTDIKWELCKNTKGTFHPNVLLHESLFISKTFAYESFWIVPKACLLANKNTAGRGWRPPLVAVYEIACVKQIFNVKAAALETQFYGMFPFSSFRRKKQRDVALLLAWESNQTNKQQVPFSAGYYQLSTFETVWETSKLSGIMTNVLLFHSFSLPSPPLSLP